MPVPDIGGLPPYANFDDVTVKVNDLVQRLKQLLLNLDTLNIRSLNAKVIEAGTITADKLNVNELSAISANLGHIISGLIESVEIYGSYISTNRTGYPKAEMSNTNNMFGAFKSPDNSLMIYSPSDKFSPVEKFSAGGVDSYIFYDPTDNRFSFTSNNAVINISTGPAIEIYSTNTRVISWNTLFNNSTGRSLQQDLDTKATKGADTGSAGPFNCGIPIGTVFKDVNGVPYTWQGVPAHTHTQN